MDVWSLAKKAPVPTLILWATRGNFPRIVYEKLEQCMLDAQILDIDSGHMIPMEHPDRVVAVTLDFAARSRIA
jgi:pimeloyl-ACP methyl ester carboxylesterase